MELPNRLFWQPDRHVDLDKGPLLAWMYETVLCEAASADELIDCWTAPTLIRLWPQLFVPHGVREAWELRHPALRGAAAAA